MPFTRVKEELKNIVVLGHGVTGNKDRPFIVALAEGLAAAGIPALRFSFSGNGASEGRFTDSTISKEVDDLDAVLDAFERAIRSAMWGHSMGGAVGVLRASGDSRIELFGLSRWEWYTRKPSHNANLAMWPPMKVLCGMSPIVRSRKPTWMT